MKKSFAEILTDLDNDIKVNYGRPKAKLLEIVISPPVFDGIIKEEMQYGFNASYFETINLPIRTNELKLLGVKIHASEL